MGPGPERNLGLIVNNNSGYPRSRSTMRPVSKRERYVSASEVVIIGAGPYGLSISTHLCGLGVDHRIVGRPMDTWRAHMPLGMYLKSEPYGLDMSSPRAGYDLAAAAVRRESTVSGGACRCRCRSNGSSTTPTGTPK